MLILCFGYVGLDYNIDFVHLFMDQVFVVWKGCLRCERQKGFSIWLWTTLDKTTNYLRDGIRRNCCSPQCLPSVKLLSIINFASLLCPLHYYGSRFCFSFLICLLHVFQTIDMIMGNLENWNSINNSRRKLMISKSLF